MKALFSVLMSMAYGVLSKSLKVLGVTASAAAGLLLYNYALGRRIEARFPPSGRFVRAGGCDLHYVERGQGRPVVLLHGAHGTLNDFAVGFLDRLARDFRAIAFDRPGHGYSTRPSGPMSPARQASVLREALRSLGLERPILVGHSWSGALVLAYALAWPDEIAGIVMLAGVSHPWKGNHFRWHTRLAGKPIFGPVLLRTLIGPLGQVLIGSGVRQAFAPDPPMPSYSQQAAVPLILRPSQFRANAQDLLELNAFLAEQSRRYGEIRVPVAIIAPSEDRSVNAELHAFGLHRRLRRSKLFVAEGAGHMPHHVQPRTVMQAIHWVAEQDTVQAAPDCRAGDFSCAR